MSVRVTELEVTAADGAATVVTRFSAADAPATAPVIVIFAAMGVRASYYRPLAEALVSAGFHAVTADLRGHGRSSVRPSRRSDFGYREIVELDMPAVLDAVVAELPQSEILVLGHSLGGQLACLHAGLGSSPARALVLVACCSVYYRCWRGRMRLLTWLLLHTARVSAAVLGFFPGHVIGFGGREARTLVRDWAHQGSTGRYRGLGSEHDYEARLADVDLPVFALSFTDDGYCPRAATEHLLAKMPRAERRHDRLRPEELLPAESDAESVGHFAWVHHGDAVAERIADWWHSRNRRP